MLFTHFGVSGPIALSASSYISGASMEGLRIEINMKPALSEKQLDDRIRRDLEANSGKQLKNSLNALLPQRMIDAVIAKSGVPADKFAHTVSKEERAALAKVLLTQPKLLLLDEPTKGIDGFFKKKFAEILAKLKESGMTVVMVSHDVEFCAEYADIVSMFFGGTVLTTDTPHRFFGQNSFYTTAANRMSRCVFSNAVTAGDVVALYKANMEDEA